MHSPVKEKTAIQICGIAHVHCKMKITDYIIPCSYSSCVCSCHVDIIVNYTTVNFFADEVTNATLTCVYSSDAIQIHHEFGGEIIDILDPGVNDDVR